MFLPWYEGVGFLQRSRVELEQRGDVAPMRHRDQLVLDPLSVGPLVATATVHLQKGQRSCIGCKGVRFLISVDFIQKRLFLQKEFFLLFLAASIFDQLEKRIKMRQKY